MNAGAVVCPQRVRVRDRVRREMRERVRRRVRERVCVCACVRACVRVVVMMCVVAVLYCVLKRALRSALSALRSDGGFPAVGLRERAWALWGFVVFLFIAIIAIKFQSCILGMVMQEVFWSDWIVFIGDSARVLRFS